MQCGRTQKLPLLTADNIRCVEGVFLHTGYHEVPAKKMVWEVGLDCHNALVSGNIRRDTFNDCLQNLHFRDNGFVDRDKYYKVRPIFDIINRGRSLFIGLEEGEYSVDEVMIGVGGYYKRSL